MTTATHQAPAEAEIRHALEESVRRVFGGHEASIDNNPAWDVLNLILDSDHARARGGWDDDFHPVGEHIGTLWADLRRSEADELRAGIEQIVERAEQAYITTVVEQAVEFATRFAEAHPDIPRGACVRSVRRSPPAADRDIPPNANARRIAPTGDCALLVRTPRRRDS